jgi:flagellar basal body-associated protein FliL
MTRLHLKMAFWKWQFTKRRFTVDFPYRHGTISLADVVKYRCFPIIYFALPTLLSVRPMKNSYIIILVSTIVLSILVIFAVSWHSLEEIHYLKSFYPQHFTVEEAFYAALVEFLKVHIISLPFVLLIAVCLAIWWLTAKGDDKSS